MHGLISTAVARMSAVQELDTAPPRLLFALALRAEVVSLISFQGDLTEPALPCVLLLLVLLAILPDMIWLRLAGDAEIVSALVTADSVFTHVLGSCLGNLLAIVGLVAIVHFPFEDLDGVAALAPDDALVLLYY